MNTKSILILILGIFIFGVILLACNAPQQHSQFGELITLQEAKAGYTGVLLSKDGLWDFQIKEDKLAVALEHCLGSLILLTYYERHGKNYVVDFEAKGSLSPLPIPEAGILDPDEINDGIFRGGKEVVFSQRRWTL